MNDRITVEQASHLPRSEYFSFSEAVKFLNEKYRLLGYEITDAALYNKIHRKQLSNTKKVIQTDGTIRYLLKKSDVDRLTFQGKIKSPELIFIHSTADMERLKIQYGDLVDTKGIIDALYQHTLEKYGVGKRYHRAAIKRRVQDGTILAVGWTGTEKRKNLWFPRDQVKLLGLRPTMRRRKKGEKIAS